MIEEKKCKEKELAKLPSDEAKRSIDLSCKKKEPEVDDGKQLKSVEPSGYNPVSEIGGLDNKTIPPKIYIWCTKI
jgi:transcription initiation factor TFIID subunit 2